MTSREATIRVRDLSHTYERWGHKVRALDDVSLDVHAGEWLMIVGPNGSGKSTLLRLLAGDLAVQRGQIHVGGQTLRQASQRTLSRVLFVVHQDPSVGTAPGLTVREHLLLADGHQWSGKEAERRAESLMEPFHLDVRLNQPVDTLSGGQRQLLVLLMAKIRPAPVVLLDEPLAALDPVRAEACLDAIGLLHADGGKTVLFVTHDLNLASSRGDRTVGLVHGKVAYDRSGKDRSADDQRNLWADLSRVPGTYPAGLTAVSQGEA